MKLLGWMNFKLKQKGNEPANTIAHKEVKSNGAKMNFQEEPYDEIFPGFLAIGTLGCQTTNTDPPTATFPMPFEHVMDGKTDITEKELKFINDELEKFLEDKVNGVAYESSESNSHACIMSLYEKHVETAATECNSSNMEEFPLQKYLFGSSVELPEIEAEVKQRGFLEELFEGKNIVQEGHVGNDGKGKKQAKKKHAMQFLKKMLQNLQSKSKGSRASSKENASGSTSSKRKLPQVLKMFKRKVHPEELMNENKLQDYKSSNISCKSGNLRAKSEENKKISPANASKVSPRALAVNKEHWIINTDADYLVLEL